MIQSVERAALILKVLGSGTPRLGVTEIAERVGLAKPTVHGLLRTLAACELVVQDPDTGKYALGPAVLQLGNAYLEGSELRARSLLWADSLAQRVNEAVWVGTLSGSRVIVLHHVFRPDDVVQILEVGAAIPWHACALGHAIAAHDPRGEELLSDDLAPLTGLTRTGRDDLERALAEVRRRGVRGRGPGGGAGGTRASPRPSSPRDGSVAGAVAVVGPVERVLDPARREEIALAVRETARGGLARPRAPRSAVPGGSAA
ncbi:IclR family transcriptional regulator [Microbispora sp. GKU 823]|uniref:IclR family transcriptional regulator n=1 Tax=Microbispora sp. GKU 823 TaxID=1652100 RepID=UPI001C4E0B31|nr:helix-turn-helix domain-containing protein [Microbispora sp. GKU 823]